MWSYNFDSLCHKATNFKYIDKYKNPKGEWTYVYPNKLHGSKHVGMYTDPNGKEKPMYADSYLGQLRRAGIRAEKSINHPIQSALRKKTETLGELPGEGAKQIAQMPKEEREKKREETAEILRTQRAAGRGLADDKKLILADKRQKEIEARVTSPGASNFKADPDEFKKFQAYKQYEMDNNDELINRVVNQYFTASDKIKNGNRSEGEALMKNMDQIYNDVEKKYGKAARDDLKKIAEDMIAKLKKRKEAENEEPTKPNRTLGISTNETRKLDKVKSASVPDSSKKEERPANPRAEKEKDLSERKYYTEKMKAYSNRIGKDIMAFHELKSDGSIKSTQEVAKKAQEYRKIIDEANDLYRDMVQKYPQLSTVVENASYYNDLIKNADSKTALEAAAVLAVKKMDALIAQMDRINNLMDRSIAEDYAKVTEGRGHRR